MAKNITFTNDKKYIIKKYYNTYEALGEIYILANLDHPFIIKPHVSTNLSLTLPYYPFKPTVTKDYIIKLVSSVVYLHDNGILHADIKPDNIVTNEHNEPILIDFGLSQHYLGFEFINLSYTKPFRPPEVKKNSSYSFSADIYALGKTIKFLTKNDPFYKKIIKKCTSMHPSERITAQELYYLLTNEHLSYEPTFLQKVLTFGECVVECDACGACATVKKKENAIFKRYYGLYFKKFIHYFHCDDAIVAFNSMHRI